MQGRINWLVAGGHCRAIQSLGPFVIGKDFEPPRPAARALPKIELNRPVLDRLENCLRRAKRESKSRTLSSDQEISDQALFADVTTELRLRNGIIEALRWYASALQFEPKEKDVRRNLARLEKAIDKFKRNLPREHEALGKFIYDTYTGTAFLRSDLKPSEKETIALEDAWRDQVGLIAVHKTLDVMLKYVSAAKSCLGKNKPRNHQAMTLVRSFACVWQDLTGSWPKSGRHPLTSKQDGPFAEFVRIAICILPKSYRIQNPDAAIRQVCKEGA